MELPSVRAEVSSAPPWCCHRDTAEGPAWARAWLLWQVTWKKQCLSPLWVGHWGMEWDLGSVLNTCPREGCAFPGVGEIHPWMEMGPPGALPSLGWHLSPKPFPALAEKGLSGVRKVISGFLGCFRDSRMKTNTGSLSLLFDD